MVTFYDGHKVNVYQDVLYVQEVVTHLYCILLYKMGHYFLDTLYIVQMSVFRKVILYQFIINF